MKYIHAPVYPLVPSYRDNEDLDTESTEKYIRYLEQSGAKVIMTTAGTTQFNLLSNEEIRTLNKLTASTFGKYKILGLPSLSTRESLKETERLNAEDYPDTALMLLFPDRFYHNSEIKDWAYAVADTSKYPVYLHGMFMRKGTGGMYNYTADLYNELAAHPNIMGTKEETSDLAQAFNVLSQIKDSNFHSIVAGGSLRRFFFLYPAGAKTFLSGIGSIFPEIEEKFAQAFANADIETCKKIIQEYETPLFNTFKNIGWHPALREALRIKGFCQNNRRPFARLNPSEQTQTADIITKLEKKLNADKLFDQNATQ